MNLEAHMSDIRFRLERLREDHLAGRMEVWRIEELLADCAAMRAEDTRGRYTEILAFISQMLSIVMRNQVGILRLNELKAELERSAG